MTNTAAARRAAATLIAALVVVAAARIGAANDFAPARAAETASPSVSVAASEAPASAVPTPAAVVAETEAPAVVVASQPPVVEAPAATAAPSIVAVPAPVPPVPVATRQPTLAPAPTLTTCAAGAWFCYPRVGISGAIVPYTDCAGSTDVGAQIRSFTCLSDHYLMAHAYTQFGRITGWQQGDVVFAYGHAYTVYGAVVGHACDAPPLPLAPLSMQTSLSTSACGPVLIVQAR